MPTFEPIETAHTPLGTPDETPRQGFLEGAEGRITLDPGYTAGLDGYEAGHDILVIWFADRADRSVVTLRDGRGVFTTRSPARPNPICLTACELIGIDGRTLEVSGVDMLDGSPVLDLKRPLEPGRLD